MVICYDINGKLRDSNTKETKWKEKLRETDLIQRTEEKKKKPLDYNSQKDKTMTSMRNEQDVLQRITRH